jgi:5'(3')-deoxyribonucleotidase
MQKFKKIYIDSDGVLAGFEAKVNELRASTPTKCGMWYLIDIYDKNVEPFFESLPIMDGAHDLVQFALDHFDDVAILTATGRTPKNVGEQKRNWYAKHFPHLEVILVESSGDKAAYACPNSILVDDRDKSITPWMGAGGIGVLHTSVEDTIAQLRALLSTQA